MADDVEFLPLEKSKSAVWAYFGFPARNGEYLEKDKKKRQSVHCKICKQRLSYKGNTTNMIVHLQYKHRTEHELVVSSKQPPAVGESSQGQPKQQSITESFKHVEPMKRSLPRWKTLTNAVSYCIAKDMLPLDCVNDSGFKHMLHTFEPRYVPPDRTTLARHYMPDLYQEQRRKIIAKLESEVSYFAFTCDGWSSRANHSYICFTTHYINTEWETHCHLLETSEIITDHTAENLGIFLEELMRRWNLSVDTLSAATTDNARNIVAALAALNWPRFGCFSHTLQLGVQKAMDIPEMKRALGRAKRLASHFHHSTKSSNILRQKQKDLHHDEQSLVQEVVTRWNSSYYMVKRILQQQQPLCATLLELRKTDLMPKDVEIIAMEVFVEVLTPLVEITETIGGEKWVTLSVVRPLLYKLIHKHLADSSSDSRLKKSLKKAILTDLKTRYTEPSVEDLIDKACFLDPRFKSLPFLSESRRKTITDAIKEEAQSISTSSSQPLSTCGSVEPPAKKKKGGLMALLEDVIEPVTTSLLDDMDSVQLAVSKEVDKYVCIDTCNDPRPLLWWKRYETEFPFLSQLARKYLCVPATSVPSERAFSTAGHIVNSKRACLLPENVDMLVFLAHNLD